MVAKNGGQSARDGFSLLEMLAVVTIMAILVTIVAPTLSLHAFSAKVKVCSQYRADLNKAIEKYVFDHSAPPASLSVLRDEDYYPADIPMCPADHTEYTIDPTSYRIIGHNH